MENINYEFDLKDLKGSISIPNISAACNFWMMRTKGGVFYDEFLQSEFIAIGWNILSKSLLGQDEKLLKKLIKDHYPKEKQPGSPLGKCKRFVHDLKPNDIVIIVGDGEIAFAFMKEYFELDNESTTVEIEKNLDRLISSNKLKKDAPAKCPYQKRHKIQVICTKRIAALNPILYKALIVNRHSLSKLNDYSEYILSACFDLYHYRKALNITFHVESVKRLSSLDVSKFIYYTTQLLCFEEETMISTKISLNSPGDIFLQLENGIAFIEAHWPFFAALALIIFGGNLDGPIKVTLPSLKNMILSLYHSKRKKQLEDLELLEKQQKVRGLILENDQKEIELEKAIKNINDSSQKLHIRPIDCKIIPLFPKTPPK